MIYTDGNIFALFQNSAFKKCKGTDGNKRATNLFVYCMNICGYVGGILCPLLLIEVTCSKYRSTEKKEKKEIMFLHTL